MFCGLSWLISGLSAVLMSLTAIPAPLRGGGCAPSAQYSTRSSTLSHNQRAVPAVSIATGPVCVSHYLSRNLIMQIISTSPIEVYFSGLLTRF